ncbi:MAG: ATP-binding cassette domain-containing protein [Hyphomicrobiaceae bacterium]|nr:ATP-binding cassette domain-containing protein [Hyphomicrobiaceae bacterium]
MVNDAAAAARLQRPSGSGWLVPLVVLSVVYLVLVGTVTNQYYQLTLTLVPVWATFGISWNILSGYSGLVSFGHAAFFGLGAYTLTMLFVLFGVTPWLGLPAAALAGAVAGLVIGYPTFRLRGHYFALSMLAYPLAMLYVFEWLGLQEVSLPMKRENPMAYMQFPNENRVYSLIALAMMVMALLISLRIERSRFGMSLLAIKQNEIAAEAAGIDTFRWKLKAIVLSGMIAGAIGGFYAVVLLVVTPASVFGMLTSAQPLIFSLFGGVGAAWGPVIGAAVLHPLTEILHSELGDKLPGIQGVVLGMAIVYIILAAPEGIFWRVKDRFRGYSVGRRIAETALGLTLLLLLFASLHLVPLLWSAPNPKAFLALAPVPLFALLHWRFLSAPPSSAMLPAVAAGPAATDASPPPAMPERKAPPPGAPVMLEVKDLSKSFGGLRAVQSVGFTVRQGDILGIIGPNGAGKTTLFNLLNGIISADAGSVRYHGEEIRGLPANAVCRLGIGRTFQVVRPFPRLSVLENVVVGAYVATPSDDDAYELAIEALERVGMAGDAHLLAGGLTTKQLRLLELARALAGKPKLLLLDETLAGLGADAVEEMLGVIRKLAADGTTIVIIEHTMHAMVRLADRFLVLDHGAVLAEGKPEEVTRQPQVIEAYLGKKWSAYARN